MGFAQRNSCPFLNYTTWLFCYFPHQLFITHALFEQIATSDKREREVLSPYPCFNIIENNRIYVHMSTMSLKHILSCLTTQQAAENLKSLTSEDLRLPRVLETASLHDWAEGRRKQGRPHCLSPWSPPPRPITVLADRSSHRWCSFHCHTLWGHVGVLAWEHVNHSDLIDPVRRSRRCFGAHGGELTLTELARFLSVEGVLQILAICVRTYRLDRGTVLDVRRHIRDVSSMAALRWGDAEPGLRQTVCFWIQRNALAAQILIWFHVPSLQDGTGAGCDRATWGRVGHTVPG